MSDKLLIKEVDLEETKKKYPDARYHYLDSESSSDEEVDEWAEEMKREMDEAFRRRCPERWAQQQPIKLGFEPKVPVMHVIVKRKRKTSVKGAEVKQHYRFGGVTNNLRARQMQDDLYVDLPKTRAGGAIRSRSTSRCEEAHHAHRRHDQTRNVMDNA